MKAGDVITLIKNVFNILTTSDDIVLRPVNGGENNGLEAEGIHIVSDDVVLLKPEGPGLELRVGSIDRDSATLNVSSSNASPANIGSNSPDHVFVVDESFILMDYHSIKIFGFEYQAEIPQTGAPAKGIWEIGIDEIDSIVIPESGYASEDIELWIHLKSNT